MAGTVTPNLTDISTCDAVGNWTGTPPVIDTDWKVQGAGCCAIQVKASVSALNIWTFGTPPNMAGKHIYVWMMVAGRIDSQANGGLRIYVEDSGGNYGYWYVAGNENYSGGWKCFVIDPFSTPTNGSGTIADPIAKVGVQFSTLSTVVGQAKNCFWDAVRYGTGLTVTSGATDQIDMEDIYNVDTNSDYKYGVVTKSVGAYVVNGLLTFGKTGSENIDFIDKSQMVIFPDNNFVSDSFYGIKVQGGTGTTNFVFGEKSGTSGIKGCLLKSVGTKKFSFDVSDNNNDKVQLYGSTFSNAGLITLPPRDAGTPTNREALNCVFDTCGEVTADTCTVANCNFVSSAGRAVKISSANHYVTDSNFIDCQTAVHHDVGGSSSSHLEYDYDNLKFSGGTYHIENSASTPNYYIDIDRLNGSNPSEAKINNSNGGTTTILAISVVLTLTGLIAGSDAKILEAGTQNLLDGTDNSGTTFNYSYNYGTYPYVDIVVLHLDYEYFRLEDYEPGSTNASLPIPLRKDRWYYNP